MDTTLEPVELAVDDGRIQGTVLCPARRLPGVLFVHGWGGCQEQDLERAREIAGLGCVCLTFDLRGHERTEAQRETVTREQNLRDLVAAYDALVARDDVDREAIAVVGISYGGYLAAILSSVRQVRWLALRSAALYPDEAWTTPKRELHSRFDLEAYRRRHVPAAENRALRACAAFHGDALVVAAGEDDIVPRPVTDSYVAALGSGASSLTMRVIAGADHALSRDAWRRAYSKQLVGWLSEMVMGARRDVARARLGEYTRSDADTP